MKKIPMAMLGWCWDYGKLLETKSKHRSTSRRATTGLPRMALAF